MGSSLESQVELTEMFAVLTLVAIAIISYFFLKKSSKVQDEPEIQPTPPAKTETKKTQKPQKQVKQKVVKPVEFNHENLISVLKNHSDTVNSEFKILYQFHKMKNTF